MRNRIVRLEQDNSPYLLDKEKGEYWAQIKEELDHTCSQSEYNRQLEFENRDLCIRELKTSNFNLFKEVLSQHPPLIDKAPYNPQEVFDDFLDHHLDPLDLVYANVRERHNMYISLLEEVRRGLKEGGPAYIEKYIYSDH